MVLPGSIDEFPLMNYYMGERTYESNNKGTEVKYYVDQFDQLRNERVSSILY